MDRGGFLFGLWSLAIAGAVLGASVYGYSPFADGGRAPVRPGLYGPTHK